MEHLPRHLPGGVQAFRDGSALPAARKLAGNLKLSRCFCRCLTADLPLILQLSLLAMSHPSEHTTDRSGNPAYVPKDALRELMVGGGVGLIAGTTLAATQTALTKENVGPKAVFLRYGSSISTFSTEWSLLDGGIRANSP